MFTEKVAKTYRRILLFGFKNSNETDFVLAYRENRILLGDPHDLKFKKENLKKILSTNIIE